MFEILPTENGESYRRLLKKTLFYIKQYGDHNGLVGKYLIKFIITEHEKLFAEDKSSLKKILLAENYEQTDNVIGKAKEIITSLKPIRLSGDALDQLEEYNKKHIEESAKDFVELSYNLFRDMRRII